MTKGSKPGEFSKKSITNAESGKAGSSGKNESIQIEHFSSERRSTPHWSLITASLIIFTFLLYSLKDHLSPLTLSITMLILLYPSRRTREIKPLIILIGLLVIVTIWWRLNALLIPFLIAFILAYAFEPLISWLEMKKLSRFLVILIVATLIVGGMVGLGFLIVPRLVAEFTELAANIPDWLDATWKWGIDKLFPYLQSFEIFEKAMPDNLQDKIPDILNNFVGKFTNWAGAAMHGTISLLSGLVNLILIPILLVYFINEFQAIKSSVYSIIPKKDKGFALELYYGLDKVLSAYIRGQLLVCAFLAVWIGLGLWLFAGLPYALLLGITAGIANLIPYVGTSIAGLLTIVIALTQPDAFIVVIKALIVFISAQALEGNVVTPRIVGERVGLHPLVIIFVVLLFASLLGFIGMLIAIPVTASIKEFLNVWIKQRNSNKNAFKAENS